MCVVGGGPGHIHCLLPGLLSLLEPGRPLVRSFLLSVIAIGLPCVGHHTRCMRMRKSIHSPRPFEAHSLLGREKRISVELSMLSVVQKSEIELGENKGGPNLGYGLAKLREEVVVLRGTGSSSGPLLQRLLSHPNLLGGV